MFGSVIVSIITKIPAPNLCFLISCPARILSAFPLGFENIHVFPKNLEISFGDSGATAFEGCLEGGSIAL